MKLDKYPHFDRVENRRGFEGSIDLKLTQKNCNIYFNEIQSMMYKTSVTFDDCSRLMDEKMIMIKEGIFHGVLRKGKTEFYSALAVT